jgi:rod shape-determining protein MreD
MKIKNKIRSYWALRWGIYAVAAVICYIIQTLNYDTVKPVLLIPFGLCVVLFEISVPDKEITAMLIGIVTGFLIDVSCGKLFGYSAFFISVFCIIETVLFTRVFTRNIFNFSVYAMFCILVYLFFDYVFYYAIWGYDGVHLIWTKIMFPCFMWTLFSSVVIYYVFKLISKLRPVKDVKLQESSFIAYSD